MELRKVTRRIVFTFVSVIAVGGLIASCSTDEYEEFGTRKTLATRSTVGTEPNGNEQPRVAWVNTGSIDDKDLERKFYSKLKYKIEWGEGFAGTTQSVSSVVRFGTDDDTIRIVKIATREGEYDTKDTIISSYVTWGGMGDDYMELDFRIIAEHIIYYYDKEEKKNKVETEHYLIQDTKRINATVKPINEFH